MAAAAWSQSACAIVVTYHPDGACAARLAALAAQHTAIIVVDNGSTPAELQPLRSVAAQASLEIIANAQNLGIATALNQGVRRAAEREFRWALLLDQDTEIERGTLDTLLAMAEAYPAAARLAIVGARFVDPMQRMSAPLVPSESSLPWEEVASVITSGSLLSLAAYRHIGAFRDDFFIDYVDEEFCMRARHAGFDVVRSKAALIRHSVGAPREGRFLWLRKWTTNHSAERRFYIARNDTVMLRESRRYRHGRWLLKSAARRLQMIKRILLFEQHKSAKVLATLQGWWAGVRGRMGPRTPP